MATDLTRNFTPADQKIWKGGARLATALKTVVIPATPSPGVNVAQTRLTMGETKALDEKHVLILQQTDVAYPTSAIYRLRIFFFRLGVLAPPNGISLSSRAFSRSEFTIRFRADPTITDGSEYGFYIEQTGA
jgi:hypothetical protein